MSDFETLEEYNLDGEKYGDPPVTQKEFDKIKEDSRKRNLVYIEKHKKRQAAERIEFEKNQKARRKQYDDYMNSEEWDCKRKIVLKEARYKCQACDAEGVPLQVHHLTYRNFMHERRGELVALCEKSCHKIADRIRELYIKGVIGK